MDELLTYHPLLKQTYDEMHLLKYAILCKNSELFFDLIDQLPKSLPDWFRKKLTFFKKHKEDISNALHLPYSNGNVEGLNNKIKVII
ncbi:transposase [Carnobacterium gallinarum]|uniref:transposase n=1 Tax=Carnobacterium gallinarum TaxID=2749 RepID=UPI00068D03DA|nr:transposase [Carnobacterium gallinarum]